MTLASTSLILKYIATVFAFVSLFSSHESISFDLVARAFFASFSIGLRCTFIHLTKR